MFRRSFLASLAGLFGAGSALAGSPKSRRSSAFQELYGGFPVPPPWRKDRYGYSTCSFPTDTPGRTYTVRPDVYPSDLDVRPGNGVRAFTAPAGDTQYRYVWSVEFDDAADEGMATIRALAADNLGYMTKGVNANGPSYWFRAYCRVRRSDGSPVSPGGTVNDERWDLTADGDWIWRGPGEEPEYR